MGLLFGFFNACLCDFSKLLFEVSFVLIAFEATATAKKSSEPGTTTKCGGYQLLQTLQIPFNAETTLYLRYTGPAVRRKRSRGAVIWSTYFMPTCIVALHC
jgi:hypothetical protein